jgi:recombinational DNA repair protein (RecF pathway)
MAILKDLAQVLHLYEQGNTSYIAVMLGRRLGQFRVHIKGGRRWPKKGFEYGFDLLARGEILVYPRSGETLWVFKEWDERARPALGTSLPMLRAASYLCEFTEVLTRPTSGSNDTSTQAGAATRERLYDLLAGTADALAQGAKPGALLMTYTLRALDLEGLLPSLTQCQDCQRKTQHSALRTQHSVQPLWLTREGLHCKECAAKLSRLQSAPERGIWLTPEAHRILLHLYTSTKPVQASPAAARLLGLSLILLVQGALERDLRTLQGAARLVLGLAPASSTKKPRPAAPRAS